MSLVMNERHAELADFYLSQARQYNSQHNYLRAFPLPHYLVLAQLEKQKIKEEEHVTRVPQHHSRPGHQAGAARQEGQGRALAGVPAGGGGSPLTPRVVDKLWPLPVQPAEPDRES